MPALALELEQPVFDDRLRRDTSMVETGRVNGGVSLHAVPPRHGILQRGRQGVSNVQATSNVRWRSRNNKDTLVTNFSGVNLALARRIRDLTLRSGLVSRRKESLLHPPVVPRRLYRQRVVSRLGQVSRDVLFIALGRRVDEFFGDGSRRFLLLLGKSAGGLLSLSRLSRLFGCF